jgi:chromosome segregation ATPase
MDEVGNVFQVHYHSGWAYMAGYVQHLFRLQHDTQCIVAEQRCHLVGYAKEVKSLIPEISRKAQEVGVVRQQVRDLESHLRDKEEALLSSIHRSSKRDQELLWHHVLLRMVEESAKVNAREFDEFQTVKDLEIQGMHEELEELEEEVHDHGVVLTNRNNIIDNLQAEIHELQQHQASAPAAPAEDADPTSDIDESKIFLHFMMIR